MEYQFLCAEEIEQERPCKDNQLTPSHTCDFNVNVFCTHHALSHIEYAPILRINQSAYFHWKSTVTCPKLGSQIHTTETAINFTTEVYANGTSLLSIYLSLPRWISVAHVSLFHVYLDARGRDLDWPPTLACILIMPCPNPSPDHHSLLLAFSESIMQI